MQGLQPEAATAPRAMKIHFIEVQGQSFPYPLALVRVKGRASWWLVDTGASHDVMALWLARAVGLEVEPFGQRGESHGGQEVGTWLVRQPEMAIDGWGERRVDEVIAVELPSVFERFGLGGVLSPQALAGAGQAAILDLPAAELTLAAADTSLSPERGMRLVLGPEPVCTVPGPTRGAVYVLGATVEGMPTRLIVDSGAARTDLLEQTRVARSLRPRTVAGGASYTAAGRMPSGRVDAVSLRIGELSTVVDLGILAGGAGTGCPRDGHLGLDVLRHCVLLLASDRFDARCRP